MAIMRSHRRISEDTPVKDVQAIREAQEILSPPASDIPIVVISGIKEPDLI